MVGFALIMYCEFDDLWSVLLMYCEFDGLWLFCSCIVSLMVYGCVGLIMYFEFADLPTINHQTHNTL
jgi:hypothetical protein